MPKQTTVTLKKENKMLQNAVLNITQQKDAIEMEIGVIKQTLNKVQKENDQLVKKTRFYIKKLKTYGS